MKDYEQLPEEKLVALCREDDEKAWSVLFTRYYALAQAIAVKLSVGSAQEEDLVSEGMFGFLSAVYSYRPDAAAQFRTYAAVCISNRMRNALKADDTKRRIPSNQFVSLEESDIDIIDPDGDPAFAAASKSEAARLEKLIDVTLTAREKQVFLLRLRGYSYQQIAQAMDLSIKAVDGTLQRARKKLQTRLA